MPIEAIHQFPQGFLWGCATAAHQVEGQNINDWWRWEQIPGKIFKDQQSGLACDWWAGRYLEDFDRAVDMHNNALRLSIEWSRIEPEPGKWDDAALDRYREMLNALRDRGLTPIVTLHHFTNPLWIGQEQGWLWDEVPTYFERYVRHVVKALGDLCNVWCTINEPMVYATYGYSLCYWSPGMRSSKALNKVMLNMLRGHAAAYHAIKQLHPEAQVGFTTHYVGLKPSWPSFINYPAAYWIDYYFNQAFPLALTDGYARLAIGRRVPVLGLKGAVDWVGLQYYQQFRVGFTPFKPQSFFIEQRKPTDLPVGPGAWGGIDPDATFDSIKWLWTTLKKPIYISESGVPDEGDGIRPGYMLRTLRAVWKAVNFNYPVRGFFWWSLLDNFEWAEGYDPRFSFGLYQTNFETQERIARRSAALYTEVCAQNGISSAIVERYAPELVPTMFPGEPGLAEVKLKQASR